MITFKKKNDVYLEFEGDKSDLRMLSDYLANFTKSAINRRKMYDKFK